MLGRCAGAATAAELSRQVWSCQGCRCRAHRPIKSARSPPPGLYSSLAWLDCALQVRRRARGTEGETRGPPNPRAHLLGRPFRRIHRTARPGGLGARRRAAAPLPWTLPQPEARPAAAWAAAAAHPAARAQPAAVSGAATQVGRRQVVGGSAAAGAAVAALAPAACSSACRP